VLKHFGDNSRKAVQNYQRYMSEAKIQERRPELVGGGLVRSLGGWSRVVTLRGKGDALDHDSRILGDAEFVAQILADSEKSLKRQVYVKEQKEVISRVISAFCAEEGVSENEIVQGSQRWKVAGVRARIALQLNREWGVSMAEIARQLGVSTSAIANALRKLEAEKK
jgi:transposase-like protein